MDILEILRERGLIRPEDVPALAQEASREKISPEEAATRRGVPPEAVLEAKSEYYKVPARVLGDSLPDEEVLRNIPQESAEHYRFVPLGIVDGALEVGMLDPDNIEATDALNFIASKINLPYKIFLLSEDDFARVIEEYQNLSGEVGEALSELDTVSMDEPEAAAEKKMQDASKDGSFIKEDAPVTKIVATILRYAVEGGASDIHVEPTIEKLRVRFRMDGELHTSLELPGKVKQAVVARIKILASLKLDEKRKPQDGRFTATVEGKRVDFRVSTFPTVHGEKIVMRILNRSHGEVSLSSLGLSDYDLETVRDVIRRPYGIVLISGPTGSGKSTTLYAMLSEIDKETRNVVSLEDPVEYDMPGVSQSQVKPEIGYTFASGLRSILRQDPNIIMVGEIRDKETAQLAIQAALTGHLVFSTIHTNTAAGVIPRLIDMGVDPYLIAPTLLAAIGQRLVRNLCPGAGKAEPVTDSVRAMIEASFNDLPEQYKTRIPKIENLYSPQPTTECPNGTRGRLGVFEILRMDKDLEEIILKHPVEEEVQKAARAKGMFSMREDALIKALEGKIAFEEVNTLGGALLGEEEA